MPSIEPIKKQTLSMAKKYKLYLSKLPAPKDKIFNKYNLMDNLNITDKAMMNEIISYVAALPIERPRQAQSLQNL